MRLVYCSHCRSLDEAPELGRPLESKEPDPIIEAIVFKHNQRDPMAHGGRDLQASPMRIAQVDDEVWANEDDRQAIIAKINEENKRVGYDAWVYESHSTFAEDALRCYSQHHRPTQGCIDYRDPSKRIGRPTGVGKDVIKDNYTHGARDPHLCDWCPVNSWVETQVNHRRGLYKG